MDSLLLYKKLIHLPNAMKVEVADFIEFLEQKAKKGKKKDNQPVPKFGHCRRFGDYKGRASKFPCRRKPRPGNPLYRR